VKGESAIAAIAAAAADGASGAEPALPSGRKQEDESSGLAACGAMIFVPQHSQNLAFGLAGFPQFEQKIIIVSPFA